MSGQRQAGRARRGAAGLGGFGGFGWALLLGSLAMAAGVALTGTSAWLITRASQHPPVLTVAVAVVGVRFFGIARPVLRYLERLAGHRAAFAILARTRAGVYDALIPVTPARLGARRQGEALAAVVDDVDAELDRLLRVVAPAVVALAVCAAAIGFQTALLPAAGAVLAVGVGVAAVLAPLLSGWQARNTQRRFTSDRARLSADVFAVLRDCDELVAAGAAGRAADAVAERDRALAAAASRAAAADGLGAGVGVAAVGLSTLVTAVLAITALRSGELSAPTAAVLVLLPLALTEVLAALPPAGTLAVRVRAARRRLRELLAAEPAVAERAHPVALPDGPCHLSLRGVTARWTPGAPPALRAIDLDLPPGRKVAVVGRSGSGKSTLAAVLLRFLDPASGDYTVNGRDALAIDPDELRGVIGLVDDAPHLFATSLAENVRLARPDATDADVEAALRRARLGDWLDSLPDGLATLLGDGGSAVSGGERARIALARAFLAGHQVLVLDEPTAALDTAAAEALLSDVLDAAADRTVVLITHRLEGLELVDSVIDVAAGASTPA